MIKKGQKEKIRAKHPQKCSLIFFSLSTRGHRRRLDLDQRAQRQRLDREARPRRLRVLVKVPGVHAVDGGEVAHVGEQHSRLDDRAERGAAGLEDRGEVFEALLGLGLNAARGELLGARDQRDLARDEEQGGARRGLDGLGVGPDGPGGLVRGDGGAGCFFGVR